MIAKPCCGSCEHYYDEDAKYFVVDKICIENCGKAYSPLDPIKSKHEMMWDELKELIIDSFNRNGIDIKKSHIIKDMEELERKHHATTD